MLPEGLYWPAHRVATSGRYTDSLATIMTRWSLADVHLAGLLLDEFEGAEADAAQRARERHGG